jgi:putative phosphoesterase
MRIAIISDIHYNLTAFLAVLEDLRTASPDLVLHGGDLVSGGSSPVEVVDRARGLRWQGVLGNTDESMARPESLEAYAKQSPAPPSLWDAVREMTAFTRDALGENRVAWLGALPRVIVQSRIALVHAHPASAWYSPTAGAIDSELESTYLPLGQPIAVYGHIHQPFIRKMAELTVINSGAWASPLMGTVGPRMCWLSTAKRRFAE